MSSLVEQTRPSQLWRSLSEERRLQAATAFWEDEQSVAEQVEAVGAIARQINFRPKSVLALPVERRARLLARVPRPSESLAGRLLIAYHLATQRPMMGTFLDGLGIRHDNGLIADEEVKPPARDTLVAAARDLATRYPVEDVRLYLSTLVMQDPDTWGPVSEVLEELVAASREPQADAPAASQLE